MTDLKQIKTFMCIADVGSSRAASDRLRIAQPALSRQIKLLEHEVGVSLFDRAVRGMKLTLAGKDLLSSIKNPIHQLEKVISEIKFNHSEISGEVNLGVLSTIPKDFTIRILSSLNKSLPGVKLRIREGYSVDLFEMAKAGDLDIVFLYGPFTEYNFNSCEILNEEIVLISPPGTRKQTGNEIHIKEIAKLPLVMSSQFFGPRKIIDQVAQQAGVMLESQFDVDSAPIIISLVESGICHGFLPISSVSHLESKGIIEVISILPRRPFRTLVLAVPSTCQNAPATQAVQEKIKLEINSMIY